MQKRIFHEAHERNEAYAQTHKDTAFKGIMLAFQTT